MLHQVMATVMAVVAQAMAAVAAVVVVAPVMAGHPMEILPNLAHKAVQSVVQIIQLQAAETAADIYEYLQNKLMLMGQFNPMERMVPMATRFQEAQDQVVQVLEVGVEVQFSLKQIQ